MNQCRELQLRIVPEVLTTRNALPPLNFNWKISVKENPLSRIPFKRFCVHMSGQFFFSSKLCCFSSTALKNFGKRSVKHQLPQTMSNNVSLNLRNIEPLSSSHSARFRVETCRRRDTKRVHSVNSDFRESNFVYGNSGLGFATK